MAIKSNVIKVRCTTKERKLWEAMAKASNLPLAAWARMVLSKGGMLEMVTR